MAKTRNERLKEALTEKGVGHEKVGKLVGRKRNTITDRLNDGKEIDSYQFIEAVSTLTGYSMEYLYHGTTKHEISHVGEPDMLYKTLRDEIKALTKRIEILEKKVG